MKAGLRTGSQGQRVTTWFFLSCHILFKLFKNVLNFNILRYMLYGLLVLSLTLSPQMFKMGSIWHKLQRMAEISRVTHLYPQFLIVTAKRHHQMAGKVWALKSEKTGLLP